VMWVSVRGSGKEVEGVLDKKRLFQEQEFVREAAVKQSLLTEEERVIWKCHYEAVGRGHFTYDDPFTADRQFTRLRHFLRGACCGNACRHVSFSFFTLFAIQREPCLYIPYTEIRVW